MEYRKQEYLEYPENPEIQEYPETSKWRENNKR